MNFMDHHATVPNENNDTNTDIPVGNFMNSPENQVKKYERVPEAGSPAQTEAWALLEAAKRLAIAITSGNPEDRETRDAMKSALRLNWRLWTIFQAELLDENSQVPREIRINMLTLAQFVDKHTVAALAKPTPEALSTLIDINRNIAAGLAQVPEGEAAAEAEAVSQPEETPEYVKIDAEV